MIAANDKCAVFTYCLVLPYWKRSLSNSLAQVGLQSTLPANIMQFTKTMLLALATSVAVLYHARPRRQ